MKPFDFNEWQRTAREPHFPEMLPRIECLDGFSMSVQASRAHYCTPRKDDAPSYSAVEVFVEIEDFDRAPELVPYLRKDGNCPWVPTEIVNAIVLAHGGLK